VSPGVPLTSGAAGPGAAAEGLRAEAAGADRGDALSQRSAAAVVRGKLLLIFGVRCGVDSGR